MLGKFLSGKGYGGYWSDTVIIFNNYENHHYRISPLDNCWDYDLGLYKTNFEIL